MMKSLEKFSTISKILIMGAVMASSLSACSLQDRKPVYGVNVSLPKEWVQQSLKRKNTLSGAIITPPTELTSFQCFGINVKGPGIQLDSSFSCGKPGTGVGITGGFIPVTQTELDVMVPAGTARVIQLVGIQSEKGCPNFAEAFAMAKQNNGDLPGIGEVYILGETTIDVFDDTAATIVASFDSTKKFFDGCNGPGPVAQVPTVEFNGSMGRHEIQKGHCAPLDLFFKNKGENPFPSVRPLIQSQPSGATTDLYLDQASCLDLNGPKMPTGQYYAPVNSDSLRFYVKTSAPSGSDVTFKLASQNASLSPAKDWTLKTQKYKIVSERLEISSDGKPNNNYDIETCQAITIKNFTDATNVVSGALGSLTLMVRANASTASSMLIYEDAADCSDQNAPLDHSAGFSELEQVYSLLIPSKSLKTYYVRNANPENGFIGVMKATAAQGESASISYAFNSPSTIANLQIQNESDQFNVAKGNCSRMMLSAQMNSQLSSFPKVYFQTSNNDLGQGTAFAASAQVEFFSAPGCQVGSEITSNQKMETTLPANFNGNNFNIPFYVKVAQVAGAPTASGMKFNVIPVATGWTTDIQEFTVVDYRMEGVLSNANPNALQMGSCHPLTISKLDGGGTHQILTGADIGIRIKSFSDTDLALALYPSTDTTCIGSPLTAAAQIIDENNRLLQANYLIKSSSITPDQNGSYTVYVKSPTFELGMISVYQVVDNNMSTADYSESSSVAYSVLSPLFAAPTINGGNYVNNVITITTLPGPLTVSGTCTTNAYVYLSNGSIFQCVNSAFHFDLSDQSIGTTSYEVYQKSGNNLSSSISFNWVRAAAQPLSAPTISTVGYPNINTLTDLALTGTCSPGAQLILLLMSGYTFQVDDNTHYCSAVGMFSFTILKPLGTYSFQLKQSSGGMESSAVNFVWTKQPSTSFNNPAYQCSSGCSYSDGTNYYINAGSSVTMNPLTSGGMFSSCALDPYSAPLPAGLSLDSGCHISGTMQPSQGVYVVMVVGTSPSGSTSSVSFTINASSMVAAGTSHSCGIFNGAAKCWGQNIYGQLGNGTTAMSLAPVPVSGLTYGVSAIAVGENHSCAIQNGAMKCWGGNNSGQLGNGTVGSNANSMVPVSVNSFESGVNAITAGNSFTCAIQNGAAKCWGLNSKGQLGVGSYIDSASPYPIGTLNSGVTAISAGSHHACAIHQGIAMCWGNNNYLQLGDGSNVTDSQIPIAVSGMNGLAVTSVAAGSGHSCVVVSGMAKCWGLNIAGQLGDGTYTNRSAPTQVSALASDVITVDARGGHTCAVKNGGTLKCWGENIFAQVGTGEMGPKVVPHDVLGIGASVFSVSNGINHTCAFDQSNFKCWGKNDFGQIGNNTIAKSASLLVADVLPGPFTKISNGVNQNGCGINAQGAVICWGNNASGVLGNNSLVNSSGYSQVQGISSGATEISVGKNLACAIVNGALRCWGTSYGGYLSTSPFATLTPSPVVGIDGSNGNIATSVSVGLNFACAVVSGVVRCWGNNASGQVGSGGVNSSENTPVTVNLNGETAAMVSTKSDTACAVTTLGRVYCWGSNNYGKLGNPSASTTSSIPVQVQGIDGTTGNVASSVSVGEVHVCALVSGAMKCWGNNIAGQLGLGSIGNTAVYTATTSTAMGNIAGGISSVMAGNFATCVVSGYGAVYCIGKNESFQLGYGSEGTVAISAIQPTGLSSNVTKMSLGNGFACAVQNSSTFCWGANEFGQLGSSFGLARYPTQVVIPNGNGVNNVQN